MTCDKCKSSPAYINYIPSQDVTQSDGARDRGTDEPEIDNPKPRIAKTNGKLKQKLPKDHSEAV